jgi:hypothetical protein
MPRIPDSEYEELAEGVPELDEPFLQQYVNGREALIAQEKKLRSGQSAFPYNAYTPLRPISDGQQMPIFDSHFPQSPNKLVRL